jgi:hypothetical protein
MWKEGSRDLSYGLNGGVWQTTNARTHTVPSFHPNAVYYGFIYLTDTSRMGHPSWSFLRSLLLRSKVPELVLELDKGLSDRGRIESRCDGES